MLERKVYKYSCPLVDLADEIVFDIPIGHQVLHVDNQFECLCIWTLVWPNNRLHRKKFRIAGTGHPITDWDKWEYRGTAIFQGGNLVFHVFEDYNG